MSNFRSDKVTVLVADDNAASRELLCVLLELEGYQTIGAEDGDQALRIAQETPIDIALLDVLMPGRTGYAVCHGIKANPATRFVPVVLVTGLSSVDERIQGIKAGADDFLNKPVNKEELLARVHSLVRIKEYTDELDNAEMVLFSLATSIEAKDPYTKGHCERLAQYSVAMAERLGLPYEQRMALRRAGTVHDIGKIGVPETILLKAGPLVEREWTVMKEHPVIGERICAPLRSFQHVLPIIRSHHEKKNGTGYPDGLVGEEIPITARILQIADVYDALATDRPYRKALPSAQCFAQMREEVRREWWDGALVNEFEAMLGSPNFRLQEKAEVLPVF